MTAPARGPLGVEPGIVLPTGPFPETPEGVGLALLYLIVDQDRSLSGRAGKPVAAYLLDLYAECFSAAQGNRNTMRETLQ